MLLQGISKSNQKQAIEIHRAADVQEDHEPVLLSLSSFVGERNRVATAGNVAPNRSPDIHAIGKILDLKPP